MALYETQREANALCVFLCKVPSYLKLPTFLWTTALQRKLTFGALDFSPLRHSPALAEHEHYTKNRLGWSGEILARYPRQMCRAKIRHSDRRYW